MDINLSAREQEIKKALVNYTVSRKEYFTDSFERLLSNFFSNADPDYLQINEVWDIFFSIARDEDKNYNVLCNDLEKYIENGVFHFEEKGNIASSFEYYLQRLLIHIDEKIYKAGDRFRKKGRKEPLDVAGMISEFVGVEGRASFYPYNNKEKIDGSHIVLTSGKFDQCRDWRNKTRGFHTSFVHLPHELMPKFIESFFIATIVYNYTKNIAAGFSIKTLYGSSVKVFKDDNTIFKTDKMDGKTVKIPINKRCFGDCMKTTVKVMVSSIGFSVVIKEYEIERGRFDQSYQITLKKEDPEEQKNRIKELEEKLKESQAKNEQLKNELNKSHQKHAEKPQLTQKQEDDDQAVSEKLKKQVADAKPESQKPQNVSGDAIEDNKEKDSHQSRKEYQEADGSAQLPESEGMEITCTPNPLKDGVESPNPTSNTKIEGESSEPQSFSTGSGGGITPVMDILRGLYPHSEDIESSYSAGRPNDNNKNVKKENRSIASSYTDVFATINIENGKYGFKDKTAMNSNPLGLSELQLQLINECILNPMQKKLAEAMADLFDSFANKKKQDNIFDVWFNRPIGKWEITTFDLCNTIIYKDLTGPNNVLKRTQLAYLLVARMGKYEVKDSDLFNILYKYIGDAISEENNKFSFSPFFRSHSVSKYEIENVILQPNEDKERKDKLKNFKRVQSILRNCNEDNPEGKDIGNQIKSFPFQIIEYAIKLQLMNLAVTLLGKDDTKNYEYEAVGNCINDLIDAAKLSTRSTNEIYAARKLIFWGVHERNISAHDLSDEKIIPAIKVMTFVKFVVSSFIAQALELECERVKYAIFLKSDLPNVKVEVVEEGSTIRLGEKCGVRYSIKVSKEGEYTLKATSPDGKVITRKVKVTSGSYLKTTEELNFAEVAGGGKPSGEENGITEKESKPKVPYDVCIADGRDAFERGDYEQAQYCFYDAYRQCENSLTLAMMGATCYHLGQYDVAVSYLNDAVSNKWGDNVSPHAHFILAYIKSLEGDKKSNNDDADIAWRAAYIELENCKKYNVKSNLCVKEFPAEDLRKWFQKLSNCATLEEGCHKIEEYIEHAKDGKENFREHERLIQYAAQKQEEAIRGEDYFPLFLIPFLSIGMAYQWQWSGSPWWMVGGVVLTITLMSLFIETSDRKFLNRPMQQGIIERKGKLQVNGVTTFNPVHVVFMALVWAIAPLCLSYLLKEWISFPDYAILAPLPLAGRVMLPAAIFIAVLSVINMLLRLCECIFGPFSNDSFMVRFLRPMLPPMRSDLLSVRDFVRDMFLQLFSLLVLSLIVATIWGVMTIFTDRGLLQQKYHYWPFRSDKTEVELATSADANNLTSFIEQTNKTFPCEIVGGTFTKISIEGENVVIHWQVAEGRGISIADYRSNYDKAKIYMIMSFQDNNNGIKPIVKGIRRFDKNLIFRMVGYQDSLDINFSIDELRKMRL